MMKPILSETLFQINQKKKSDRRHKPLHVDYLITGRL